MASDSGSWFARLFRRAPAPTRAATAPVVRRRPDSPYHAVSLAVGRECCRQVEALIGTRFLASEAPKLPLAGCTAKTCRCRYLHHVDRRTEADRRLRDLWKLGVVNAGEERRKARGRRVPDGQPCG